MPAELSTFRQFLLLVRLKYHLSRVELVGVGGTRFSTGLVWLRLSVLLGLALGLSVKIFSDLRLQVANADAPAQIVAWLTLFLTGLLLYDLLAPISIFRSGRELNLQHLRSLPLRSPVFFAGRSLAALLDPEVLLSLLPLLAIAAALGTETSFILVLVLIIVFFLASVVLGQACYVLVEVAYQDRWLREILFAIFATLACVAFCTILLLVSSSPEQRAALDAAGAQLLKLLAWLPSGWVAQAISAAYQGNYAIGLGVLLALVLMTSVLIGLSSRGLEYLYYQRGYLRGSTEWRAGPSFARLGVVERIFSRETTAVLMKDLLLFRRSPWWFLFFVTWPLMVLSAVWIIPALREPSIAGLLLFACIGALDTLQGLNWLAAESKGLPMLFVLPLSYRALILGKNLRVLATMLVEMFIGFTLYLSLIGLLDQLPYVLAFNLSAILLVLSAVNLVSVFSPQEVSSFEFLPRMPLRLFVACIVSALMMGLPLLVLIWLSDRDPGWLAPAAVLAITYGLLFYRGILLFVGHYLERQAQTIYSQLTQTTY
jgi:hypothetical protein